MKLKQIKKFLLSEIELLSNNATDYIRNPERDFSRNRKLPFSTIIKSIIGMESKSLTNELIDFFDIAEFNSTISVTKNHSIQYFNLMTLTTPAASFSCLQTMSESWSRKSMT